ncbi:hypothetical protein KUCAC02_004543, partial [Chaenocephalus aceratus]
PGFSFNSGKLQLLQSEESQQGSGYGFRLEELRAARCSSGPEDADGVSGPDLHPGELTASASGSTSVELAAPLSVNVTLEKEVAGFWVKVPCLEELGSCHYEDACDILSQLIPPGQDCPEPLHTYGLPCHCPFKAGSYSLPQSDFTLPTMDLPYWLSNGNYRMQGVLGAEGKELGCLKLSLSLHSD